MRLTSSISFRILAVLILTIVQGATIALATNVPFSSANTIDGAFDSAWSVFSADIDGDGDMDALGAAYFADDITWWENTAGDGSAWTEHTVDANFDGAISVFSADIDGDGDMDVLGAANEADDIT